MVELPTGIVTFLFTDVEGSTRLLEQFGDHYAELQSQHDRIIRAALEETGGIEVSTEGDAFFAVFDNPRRAVEAAVAIQQHLNAAAWPDDGMIRVRIGLHSGEGRLGGGNYTGLDVNRAARIASAAHGGQVLLSVTTRALTEWSLPEGVSIRDLGSHRLKDLSQPERLSQLVIDGLRSDFSPPKTLDVRPHNLPVQLTSFVGRERETAEIVTLLNSGRLVTLTGPGGAGKTRLAVHAAAEVIQWFPDGVVFIPLSPIRDPKLVPSAIATALGLPPSTSGGAEVLSRVSDYLASRRLLLVLDNFEQILAAAALVTDLLRAAAGLKVLVTSRAPLHLQGEQEYPVQPLDIPDRSRALKQTPTSLRRHASVQLFVDRARAVRPAFELTMENAPKLATIAARLDGLPLAIELAAAWTRVLPVEALAARLEDRLELPHGGIRDLPARQRTLRDAIDWSYELLDEPARDLFRRLSVFVGGATFRHVELVTGDDGSGFDVLDGLGQLVDHSLLQSEERAGEPRFVMLEVIREFASDRLCASGEAPQLHSRHAEVFLEFAEQVGPQLMQPDRNRWLDRVEQEHDNLRAAVDWLTEHNPNAGARLVAALWRFWQMRGYLEEGTRRTRKVLARELSPASRAGALAALASLAYWRGDKATCLRAYQESLEIHRRLGDPQNIANALYDMAFPLWVGEDYEQATALAWEALDLYEQLQDAQGVAKSLWLLGVVATAAGQLEQARDHLYESVARLRELDDPFHLGWALCFLGRVELRLGQTRIARENLRQSLTIFIVTRDVSAILLNLADFAHLALIEHQPERTLRLYGAMTRLRRVTGIEIVDLPLNRIPDLDRAMELLGPQATSRLHAEGEAMDMETAVAYALREN